MNFGMGKITVYQMVLIITLEKSSMRYYNSQHIEHKIKVIKQQYEVSMYYDDIRMYALNFMARIFRVQASE